MMSGAGDEQIVFVLDPDPVIDEEVLLALVAVHSDHALGENEVVDAAQNRVIVRR